MSTMQVYVPVPPGDQRTATARRAARGGLAPRPRAGGDAPRLGLLDNNKVHAGAILDHVARRLGERVGAVATARERKWSASVPADAAIVDQFLRRCDAVVTAVGD